MSARQPIITDPEHLARAARSAYVCLRPSGGVAEAFDGIQRGLREVVGDDPASWPAAHMTLKGFGSPERRVDDDAEPQLVTLVEGWARETAPLELEVDAVDAFAAERIPVVRIRRTQALGAALADLRGRSTATGLTGDDDHIAPGDWIFHLSLVYYEGERWSEVEAAVRAVEVPRASCVVEEAELVGFDGGPERLLGRLPLLGSV